MSKKSSSDPKRLEDTGSADVAYYIQYTTDMKQFSLTMDCDKIPFENTQEVLNAIQTFLDDCIAEGKDFFDEADLPIGNPGGGLH